MNDYPPTFFSIMLWCFIIPTGLFLIGVEMKDRLKSIPKEHTEFSTGCKQ